MGDNGENVQTHHTEEAIGRIAIDHVDRKKMRDTLDLCIDPMDDTSHSDGKLLNIARGQSASPEVNVDTAVSIGQRAMLQFTNGWPNSFYDSLSKLVVTMDVKQKQLLVGKKRVYDQELIYTRVIGLIASARDINIDDVLSFELAAYRPSMFASDRMMKICTTKSSLKKQCWPNGKLSAFVDSFREFVYKDLQITNVILVFDRYFSGSIKTYTRLHRAGSSNVHKLLKAASVVKHKE